MIVVLSHILAGQLASLHNREFDRGWQQEDFMSHIENPMDDVFGVLIEDKICGFIVLRTQDDQAEILTIVVDKVKQNKGFGRQLLQYGEKASAARGAHIMFLDVAKDNVAAIRLYETFGYQRCGVRRGYYRRAKGRVDGILMQKHLERE